MSEALDLEARRRRIKYRAWHRGLRELELLLGRFVDARIETLDAEDVAAFEVLLDVPDQVLLDGLMADAPPEPTHDTKLWRAIVAQRRRA